MNAMSLTLCRRVRAGSVPHPRDVIRSARGPVDNPGTNVMAKSDLNREILGIGWHSLKEKHAYKCEMMEIDPASTSQACNVCGRVDKASRPSQAGFKCVACGHADIADLNAARTGIGASARRRALALAIPVTRETDRMVA